jgi:hypothetical protein
LTLLNVTYNGNGQVSYNKDCPVGSAGVQGGDTPGLLAIDEIVLAPDTPAIGAAPANANKCENALPQNEALAWLGGTAMEATANFSVTGNPAQPTSIWVVGSNTSVPTMATAQTVNNQPTFMPQTLAPGANTFAASVYAASVLPAQTNYLSSLQTQWVYSGQSSQPNPATCVAQALCRAVGNTTSALYVVLNQLGAQPPRTDQPVSRTAINLATQGGATDARSALAQTWNQFSGNNANGWDGRPLVYYNSTTNPP